MRTKTLAYKAPPGLYALKSGGVGANLGRWSSPE